ncbi:hypothetical protein Tco_0316576 [Tanacetum coccineum]
MEDGPRYGLHLNVDKTEVFWPKEDLRSRLMSVFPSNIDRPSNGVKLLGGPASVDFDFCSQLVMKRVAKTIELIDAVAKINDPQCELLLLHSCTGIYMRTCSPRVFESAQHSFDVALRSSLERIVTSSGAGFRNWQWRLTTLPFAFGGIGVYSAASEPNFDDALCVFNMSMVADFLSNPSEIAAPKLMKKWQIYISRGLLKIQNLHFPYLIDRWPCGNLKWRITLLTSLGRFLFLACSRVFAGDINGDHDVSCAGIIGIKHRHNIVRDTLVDICYRSGISDGKEVDIWLDGGRDKPLRLANMLLYSWDGGLDVCVDLTGSSPLTQIRMADFVPGRVVIDIAQRKCGKYMDKCATIEYGFLSFSFSSLGELEADVVIFLKRIQKFSMTHDIGARAVVHIFNRIGFSIAKGMGAQIPGAPSGEVFRGVDSNPFASSKYVTLLVGGRRASLETIRDPGRLGAEEAGRRGTHGHFSGTWTGELDLLFRPPRIFPSSSAQLDHVDELVLDEHVGFSLPLLNRLLSKGLCTVKSIPPRCRLGFSKVWKGVLDKCKSGIKSQRQDESIANAIQSWGIPGGSLQLVREALAEPPFHVLDMIKSFPHGMSYGCDGLRAQHLMDCLSGEYIASAPLTPLVKSGGNIRPIVVGTVWQRLVSKLSAAIIGHSLDGYLNDLQFSVGVSGGGEAILHVVNQLIKDRGDDVGLSMLLGVQQGDPFGPLPFALMLHHLVCKIRDSFNLSFHAWYLDGDTIIGDTLVMGEVLKLIMEDGPRHGLHLNVDKTKVFWPKEDLRSRFGGVFPPNIARPLHSVKLLGRHVNADFDFSSELVMKRVSKSIELMDVVAKLNDPQCELMLLRACPGISKLYFFMRICSPKVFEQAQRSFDAALHSALERIVTASGPRFGDWQWRLSTLPFAFERLGVYS